MAENIGEFGLKSSATAGKGSVISSTFGESWLKSVEERLSKRRMSCSKCGVSKPSGKCESCGYEPTGFCGW